jgi:hypothetical protein
MNDDEVCLLPYKIFMVYSREQMNVELENLCQPLSRRGCHGEFVRLVGYPERNWVCRSFPVVFLRNPFLCVRCTGLCGGTVGDVCLWYVI